LTTLLAMCASPAIPASATAPAAGTGRIASDPIAHDPTVIKQGRYYYSIITGDIGTRTYLPIRRSTDRLHWTLLGTVFTTPPAWVVAELGLTPGDFWAPDINFFHGEYHLYYAASSFGTNNSVIGLATNKTLDPDSADYRWVDRGMVIRSRTTDNFNAIDPDVVFDAHGTPWLSFGSFWDGIKMRRLDRATGLLSAADQTLYPLASRSGASIEGPSIVRHGRFYYLFASLDFCCRGVNSDYRVVVGRSTSLAGPYVDRDGVAMLAGGGTDLLRGYNEFRGPGGGDVFSDGHADYFAHHYYDTEDGGAPKLSVRRISWADGWPSLGDPLSGSSRVGHGNAYFTVVNRSSGAAMDNPTCGYEGADIRLSAPSASTCQQWRPEDRGGGYVSLLNRQSNKVAEVAACVNADGARVALWGWLNNDCQMFRSVATDNGWSRIENRLAGRVLEAAGCGGAGSAVQAFTWLGNACQQFRFDPVGDVLIADTTGRLVLDVARCGKHDDRRVVASVRRPSDCQLWRFANTEEGYYRIVNRRNGRPITVTTGADGLPRLVLGDRNETSAAAQWRIEAVDGGYRLVNRDGRAAELTRHGAGAGTPDGSGPQRLLLLTP
jgi:arabinan endo-1,5-alpha-L-arabinosidase